VSVLIAPGPATEYRYVVPVFEAALSAGFNRVSFANR